MLQIFGKKDNHISPEGRDLIRRILHEKGVCFSFYEVAHAQRRLWAPSKRKKERGGFILLTQLVDAFIRDELSKGRYDPAISGICFEMLLELFNRTLKLDLGPRAGGEHKVEDVC